MATQEIYEPSFRGSLSGVELKINGMLLATGKIVPALRAVFDGIKGANTKSEKATAYPSPSELLPMYLTIIRETLFPRPVFLYPNANINAAKMSQITLFEKPDNAQEILSLELPTKPVTATKEIPANPTNAAGTGSIINPTTTAKNTAKNRQASMLSPSGAGINYSNAKTIIGENNFKLFFI
jgi:hypothetical protein